MKTLSTCALAVAALLSGIALAGEPPRSDAPGMRADTDGDGRVSRAEATAAATERTGDWFDKADLDKDGYVTAEELKQGRATRQERREEMRAHLDQRFREADANGDGQLSLDEAQAKMPKLAQRFSVLDVDKNGLLSRDELKRGPGRAQPQD
jgi:Ca2+-binding EF-hand superfamily protein